jgi:putative transposase
VEFGRTVTEGRVSLPDQYAGLETHQVREFKQLAEENARLKKLVADLSLDKAVLQDVLSKKFPGPRS